MFDRLYQYKVRNGIPTWEQVIERVLAGTEETVQTVNAKLVEDIANAVLYEGYMLYPYRPSSVKNRQRWNFGVVYPKSYSEMQNGTDNWFHANGMPCNGKLLHGVERQGALSASSRANDWRA